MNLLAHPSHVAFLLGFVVYIGIRGRFEKLAKGQQKTIRRVDGAEKTLLVGVGIGCGVLPLLYLCSPWLDFADVALPVWAPWLGGACFVLGLWLFARAHADLGPNWSVTLEVRSGHELVQQGVYRRVRHPMYAAIFLVCLAQGLMLHNWLAGWAALASFGLLYLVRVPKEEALMHEVFGEAWRAHAARTGRLLPRRGS